MTNAVIWDNDHGDVVIIARVKPGKDMEDLDKFVDEIYDVARLRPGAQKNWHPVFMKLISTITDPLPGQEKLMIHSIKFWRLVSGCGLPEAKSYVEQVTSNRRDPPVGDEHPDIDPEVCQHYMELVRGKEPE